MQSTELIGALTGLRYTSKKEKKKHEKYDKSEKFESL